MSVRHALLALLSEGPKYGLQLRQEFEERTGEVWPLNVGQVYTTLQRLERDGSVESDDSDDEGPQKSFRITATGKIELDEWLRTPPDLSSPPRDELVMKVLIAVRLPGVNVTEVIQSHRRYLVQLMQQWTRLKGRRGPFRSVVCACGGRRTLSTRLRRSVARHGGGATKARVDRTSCKRGAADAPHEKEGGHTTMSYLELRGVSKIYGQEPNEVHALSDINLSVDAGSLVAVMGASGSGKSTLLTIAGSLEAPTMGDVLLGRRCPVQDVARRSSANEAALDRLRVSGLQLVGRIECRSKTCRCPWSWTVCREEGAGRRPGRHWRNSVWPIGPRFPDELSGGERQRVSIARAVVGERHLLLADEPSGALDSTNAEAVMRLILTACRRGVAAVVVTHDAQLASWADRVIFLRDGHVVDQTLPSAGPEALLESAPRP